MRKTRRVLPSGLIETIIVDEAEERLTIEAVQDAAPVMEQVRRIRDGHGGKHLGGEVWHVGRIPVTVLETWLREAGVDRTDRDAVIEVIKRKLLSGEYNAFRPVGGTW